MYSRELAGDTLTLGASGWTYESTFVLYDFKTESLWYHLDGTDGLTCISGPLADNRLPELQSVVMRWRDWKRAHPNSKFLDHP